MVVGPRPFGLDSHSPGIPLSLVLGWAVAAAALISVSMAAAGRRPPLATGGGFLVFALVVPGFAIVDESPSLRIVAVAVGAALPLTIAAFCATVGEARRRVVLVALAGSSIVAVMAKVLLREPIRELRCAPYCGDNPLLLVASPGWLLAAERVSLILALCWCAVAVADLARSRLSRWVRASTTCAIAACSITSVASLLRPGLTMWGEPDAATSVILPALLIPALLLSAEPDLRIVRTRSRVRGLATDLAQGFSGDGVAAHLRPVLRDPSIRLLFPVRSGGYVDEEGQSADRVVGWMATAVERDGEQVAVIEHESTTHAALASTLSPAVTVAVDNERLRALARSELAALRTSRRRVVERADETRRRLERDLHDGVQQRLLLLGMELSHAAERADPRERTRYLAALGHTQDALAELRRLVHDNVPPVLDELGVGEALRSLAETSPLPMELEIDAWADRRAPLPVERAIYTLVTSLLHRAESLGASAVRVSLGESQHPLIATICHDGSGAGIDLTDAEDRVGAVGGDLDVTVRADRIQYVARFS